jgi:hypothetical protein
VGISGTIPFQLVHSLAERLLKLFPISIAR